MFEQTYKNFHYVLWDEASSVDRDLPKARV